MTRWNGDEWRWWMGGTGRTTISVIDSAEKRDEPENAHRVPFGFGIREPQSEVEPLLWEGDGA